MNKFSDNRFMKAIEQIATNSVNNAIKNNAIAQAKTFGMAGAGLGFSNGQKIAILKTLMFQT